MFLKSGLAASALGFPAIGQVRGANDRVQVALIGCGGRGAQVTASLARRSDVECSQVCDIHEERLVRIADHIAEQQGGTAIAEALRNSHPSMKGRALPGALDLEQIPELAERGRLRVAAFFDVLEKRLGESAYLAGENFSWADITTFVFVDFARVIKMRIPEGNSATRDWFDRIAARPSANL